MVRSTHFERSTVPPTSLCRAGLRHARDPRSPQSDKSVPFKDCSTSVSRGRQKPLLFFFLNKDDHCPEHSEGFTTCADYEHRGCLTLDCVSFPFAALLSSAHHPHAALVRFLDIPFLPRPRAAVAERGVTKMLRTSRSAPAETGPGPSSQHVSVKVVGCFVHSSDTFPRFYVAGEGGDWN